MHAKGRVKLIYPTRKPSKQLLAAQILQKFKIFGLFWVFVFNSSMTVLIQFFFNFKVDKIKTKMVCLKFCLRRGLFFASFVKEWNFTISLETYIFDHTLLIFHDLRIVLCLKTHSNYYYRTNSIYVNTYIYIYPTGCSFCFSVQNKKHQLRLFLKSQRFLLFP